MQIDTGAAGDTGTTVSAAGKAALLAAALPVTFGLYSIGLVLPAIGRDFTGTPHAALLSQLVGGLPGLAFALVSPSAGRLVERIGVRGLYFWSLIVFAIAGACGGLVGGLYMLLATRLFVGAAVAGVLVAAMTGIGMLPGAQRARMLGFFTLVGGVLALSLYAIVARLAVDGWRPVFALHLAVLLALPLLLALPRARAEARAKVVDAPMPVRDRLPPGLLAVALFVGMAGVIPGLFTPFYLAGLGISDPSQIMIPLMATSVAVMPASASYGWFQRRIGVGGMFAACFLLTGLGAALASQSGTVTAVSAAMVVMGLGLGVSAANLNAAAVAVASGHPGRMIGIVNSLYYGAQALFPFVAQGLQSLFGAAGVFEAFAAISLVLGAGYAATSRSRRA